MFVTSNKTMLHRVFLHPRSTWSFLSFMPHAPRNRGHAEHEHRADKHVRILVVALLPHVAVRLLGRRGLISGQEGSLFNTEVVFDYSLPSFRLVGTILIFSLIFIDYTETTPKGPRSIPKTFSKKSILPPKTFFETSILVPEDDLQ